MAIFPLEGPPSDVGQGRPRKDFRGKKARIAASQRGVAVVRGANSSSIQNSTAPLLPRNLPWSFSFLPLALVSVSQTIPIIFLDLFIFRLRFDPFRYNDNHRFGSSMGRVSPISTSAVLCWLRSSRSCRCSHRGVMEGQPERPGNTAQQRLTFIFSIESSEGKGMFDTAMSQLAGHTANGSLLGRARHQLTT